MSGDEMSGAGPPTEPPEGAEPAGAREAAPATAKIWQIGDLPLTLPIFPLTGVLLLPRTNLPLNIFEPRYLNMVRDALASDRLIGMVQPVAPTAPGTSPADPAAVYGTGCAGTITAAQKTPDGRILISLTGVARFGMGEEIPALGGYRRVKPDWQRFAGDLAFEEAGDFAEDSGESRAGLDRPRLFAVLRAYLAQQGAAADWASIEAAPDETLVNSLAMILPFSPGEKQALLEAPDLCERGRVLTALLEMAVLPAAPPPDGTHRH